MTEGNRIRLPKKAIDELNLSINQVMICEVDNGRLILTPAEIVPKKKK